MVDFGGDLVQGIVDAPGDMLSSLGNSVSSLVEGDIAGALNELIDATPVGWVTDVASDSGLLDIVAGVAGSAGPAGSALSAAIQMAESLGIDTGVTISRANGTVSRAPSNRTSGSAVTTLNALATDPTLVANRSQTGSEDAGYPWLAPLAVGACVAFVVHELLDAWRSHQNAVRL